MQDINLAARILGHWKCLMIQIYVQNHLYNFIYIYIFIKVQNPATADITKCPMMVSVSILNHPIGWLRCFPDRGVNKSRGVLVCVMCKCLTKILFEPLLHFLR